MAKKNKAVEVLESSAALSEANTMIRRLIEDAELREAVGRAIESSRSVFDRVSNTKKPSKLLEDKKLQNDALDAIDAIRTVTVSLTGVGKSLPQRKNKKKKKVLSFGRLLILGGVGGGAAVVASEGLRSKILDALFGAEEEFEYTPPPAPPATETSGSSLSAV